VTSPIRLLRHLLFLPCGNPTQQEKDVAAIEQELRSGKDQVRAARLSIEKSHELRATFARLLERT
jgi:hypothetical protein